MGITSDHIPIISSRLETELALTWAKKLQIIGDLQQNEEVPMKEEP
jgi:hypothetical protein